MYIYHHVKSPPPPQGLLLLGLTAVIGLKVEITALHIFKICRYRAPNKDT